MSSPRRRNKFSRRSARVGSRLQPVWFDLSAREAIQTRQAEACPTKIRGRLMDAPELWKRYRQYLCRVDSLDLSLDISRMHFDEAFLASMEPAMQQAFNDMDALESGAIANPDEKRMVGHYWLRAPQLAPTKEIAREITGTVESIKKFAADVHAGKIKPPMAARFTQVLAIGIGGSALGPDVRRRRAGRTCCGPHAHPFHRQHRSRRHRAHARNAEGTSPETLCHCDQQERRHAGDAQRHAGRRRGLSRRGS